MELSNGSNGWFRFILDGKLATMYSSGSPEGGSDSSGKGSSHPHSDYQNSGSNSHCTLFLRSKMISSACISRGTLTSEEN